jgi:hypothetical protein
MKSHLIFTLFFALGILLGCKEKTDNTAHIKLLDSLSVEVVNSMEKFNKIDSLKVKETLNLVNQRLGQLGSVIKDTIEKEDAILISDFRACKKPLKEFQLKRSGLRKESGVTLKQLENLSRDLKKNLVPAADVKKFVEMEAELANLLLINLSSITESVQNSIQAADSLGPVIEAFIAKQAALPQKKK